MILVFGSINIDLVARVAAIPRPGETVLAERYETLFGGKGANQAVAASRALGKAGAVVMVGRVGHDGFGDSAVANLARNGVTTDHVRAGDAPTGCAFISVDTRGENAITVAAGANGTVSADDADAAVLTGARVVVLQMEVPVAANIGVARRARALGARVVWNLAPAPATLAAELCRDILAATDVLVVNEHEALAVAAALGTKEADYAAAASTIAARGHCTCVVTAGAEGALAVHADGRREQAPAREVTPVDTTGAGDTFVGVLATGIAEGLAFSDALRRACYGASLACLGFGAQSAMPERAAIEEYGAPVE
jgi:ribokinase